MEGVGVRLRLGRKPRKGTECGMVREEIRRENGIDFWAFYLGDKMGGRESGDGYNCYGYGSITYCIRSVVLVNGVGGVSEREP